MTDFQLERMDTPYGIEIIILNEINRSQRKKLKKKISKNLFTLSKGGINDEFFEDAFSDSEILIIGKDSDKNGNLHSIRGFALIQVDKSQYEYLNLALLCCAERPTVKTRQNTTSFRGTDFISLLKCFCINNYYQGITLYSLHQVMTYYYKYGWKLQTRTDTKYNLRGYDIHNLKEFRETMDTYDDTVINKYLLKYNRLFCDFYKEDYIDKELVEEAQDEEFLTLRDAYIEYIQCEGYPMIWNV